MEVLKELSAPSVQRWEWDRFSVLFPKMKRELDGRTMKLVKVALNEREMHEHLHELQLEDSAHNVVHIISHPLPRKFSVPEGEVTVRVSINALWESKRHDYVAPYQLLSIAQNSPIPAY